MPISVTCPGCNAKLNAPDAAAGKKVKCPKCQGAIVVPAAPQFEVVEDEAPPQKPAATAPSKPKVQAVAVDDDDAEAAAVTKPIRKPVKAAAADDDDEDKPKKKAKVVAAEVDDDDAEENEEKPKKKKKKKKSDEEGSVSMTRNIVGGVVLLVLVGVAAFVYYDKYKDRKDAGGTTTNNNTDGETPNPKPNPKQPEPNPKGPGPNPKQPGTPNPKQPSDPNSLKQFYTIYYTAFSADGRWGALHGLEKLNDVAVKPTLRVWETAGGGPFKAKEFDVPQLGLAGQLALSHDGSLVAVLLSGEKGGTLHVVKVATGEIITTAKIEHDRPTVFATMAFTSDASSLVIPLSGKIFTVNVSDGKVDMKKYEVGILWKAVYNAKLNRVVSVEYDRGEGGSVMRFFDPAKADPLDIIPLGGIDVAGSMAVSADGKVLAVSQSHNKMTPRAPVVFFDVATGKRTGQLPADTEPDFRQYTALALSADGKYLAGTSWGTPETKFFSADVFRVSDGKRLFRDVGQPPEHQPVYAEYPRFSADGKYAYFVTKTSNFVCVDVEKGVEVPFSGTNAPMPKPPVKEPPPKKEPPKKEPPPKEPEVPATPATELKPLKIHNQIPIAGNTCMAASPDGVVVVGSLHKNVYVFNVSKGGRVETLDSHESIVDKVAISPNSKWMASGGRGDKTILIREVATKRVFETIKLDASLSPTLAFSPDSKTLLVTGDGEKNIKLWDTNTHKVRETLPIDHTAAAAYSADGAYLVTAGDEVKVWDLKNLKEPIATLKGGHRGRIQALAITPDGETVITGSADSFIKIWDVKTAKVRTAIKGHGDVFINSLALTADGKFVISGGNSKAAGVWEVATGRGVASAPAGDNDVYGVAIIDKGKALITASGSNSVRQEKKDWMGGVKIWDLTSVTNSKSEANLPPTAADKRQWQEYKSNSNDYKLSFPSAGRQVPKSAVLEKLKVQGEVHMATGGEKERKVQVELYYAGHIQYPAGASADDKKRLRDQLGNELSVYASDGKITQQEVTVGKHTWEEVQRARDGKNGLTGGTVLRTLEIGDRLYFMVGSREDGLPPADMQKRFFESFELLR